MSSNDSKIQFDSQFCRMNCQMFSWLLRLRRAGRQWQERNVAWDLEVFGAMPAGLIKDNNCMGTRGDLGGNLIEMKLHGFAVAGWQHEGSADAAFRTNRAK